MKTKLKHYTMHHSKKCTLVTLAPKSSYNGFYINVPNSDNFGVWLDKKEVPAFIELLNSTLKEMK